MRSAFTYRDALRILGSADQDKLALIDRILGGAILGSGAIGLSAVFALVDHKNEATRLARELLVAAHTTIVVTAAARPGRA